MAKKGRRKTSELQDIFGNRSYRNIMYGAATVLILFVVGVLGLNLLQRTGNVGEPGVETEREERRTYTVREGDTLWSISQDLYNDAYQWPKLAEANKLASPDAIEEGMSLIVPELTGEPIAQAATATPTTQAATPTRVPTITPTRAAPTPTKSPTSAPAKVSPTPESDAVPGSKGAATGQTATGSAVPPTGKITGNTYTVVAGDNLWDIAVRAYGDGFKWVEIARLNNLTNPDLIHPGNKFNLPR